ncbi:MAG: mannonate dehydratase [Spirochaetales bacterium]|nr:mannonate dehydratase [Spirochaetales bacterium]
MSTDKPYPLRAVPGLYSTHSGIQIASTIRSTATDEDLQFLQQLGIEWVMVNIDKPSDHHVDYYRGLKARLARFDLQIYRIANHAVHNVAEITLNLPGRERKIDEFIAFVRNLGKAGIRYHTYAHMANGIWSSGRTVLRGGMSARTLDPSDATGHWIDQVYQGELTHGREYSEDEIWDNYEFMIRRVAPVAEEAGVYIGIHPDDPPVYTLGGVPRCIFGNFDGYKRALEIADSPNIGVCLCVGCWLEGGPAAMGSSVIDAIHYFAGIDKLFKVHFRNVTNPMPDPLTETLMDDGYMDMYAVMRALRQVDFDGCIIPDHIPQLIGGDRSGVAYSIAYMKALVQAVNTETGHIDGNLNIDSP